MRTDNTERTVPLVTWTLIILNTLIFLWDRSWHPFGTSTVFGDLTMRPQEVIHALQSGNHFALVTLFTSMFLHASWLHIAGNMLFLYVFGPPVEAAFGGVRFATYYLSWGIVAGLTQVFVNSASMVPTLGASGAIGGVLGAYFLLFPTNRIEIMVPPFFFIPFELSAWVMLGIWFLYQIIFPQEGVANWAHAGGFLAGMVTVLVMGGRSTVLEGFPQTSRHEPSP